MGRSAAVDYGTRRIGLALSDFGETIASPADVLASRGGLATDARAVADWAAQNEVTTVIVGWPLNMNGTIGPQAELSRKFAAALRDAAPALQIELADERLSSYHADTVLDQAGLSPTKRKRLRDALAAQMILQTYLDRRRGEPKL